MADHSGGANHPGGWVRQLFGALMRHRRYVILAFTAAVFGSAAQIVVPLIGRQIVDDVVVTHRDALWPWLVVLFAAAGLTFALAYVRRYRGGQVALQVQLDLRNAIHDHLLSMDAATLARMPTGQLVSRSNSDSGLIQGLLQFLPLVTGNALSMVLSLAVMFVLSPPLALLALIVLPALFAVSYRMRRRVFPASWDAQQREGDVAQIVDEGVTGVRVVKAFGQETRELERLAAATQTLYGARMRSTRLTARYQPLLETIPTLGQVAILLFGGLLALHGEISLGTFLAFSTYVGQFVSPARQIAAILTVGQQARAGVERIFSLLALQPAIADAPDAVELTDVRGEIVFDDVSFAYSAGRPVLDGFSLRIAPGERVALVGTSGSGKSTVTTLMSRFHDPASGAVRLDGHDLRTVTLHSLRSQVGVAFEESFLFSDTIAANIAYGRTGATQAQIEAAAHTAQAHDFVTAMPDGYDTVVGERGLTLSGGQRQRVALARAILTDPRVLVLDDATSAIDARTEEAIHDGLRDVLAGRTTLLVAHRVSTLHLADRVAVLDRGRVVDEGTHQELWSRSVDYRALLSGLEDDDDPLRAAGAGGDVDALAGLAGRSAGVTAAAWRSPDQAGAAPVHAPRASTSTGIRLAATGARAGAMIGGLPPTPELLAAVDALPAVRDAVDLDLAAESVHEKQFGLLALLRRFRRPLLIGLVLVVLDALAGLAGPYLVQVGVDSGVQTGSKTVLFAASGAYLAVSLADMLALIGSTFVTGRTAERIMLSLRVRIWAQLQRLSLDYYERELAGRIMTRMTTDVDQFESLVSNGLLSALVAFVTFVGVGVTLLLVDLELGLITLSVVVPLAIATVWFRRRAARLYDLSRERIAVVNADFQESLSGVREAQAFVHEDASSAHFHELGESYLRSRVGAQRLVATYFPFVQFLSSVADALVLGVGAVLIRDGDLQVGALIAFLLYIDMFFSPIQQLSQVFDSWQQTRVSVARIADLMRLDTLTPEPAEPAHLGRLRGAVELEDVTFTYPGSAAGDALRGVDLTIRPGETVALVGETGAGKSTVLKLLARFYDPVSGRVCLDGRDLRSLDLHEFRSHLGYVPQEAFLFTGSVRDNIAYGRPAASDAEVEAAARAVGAHDVVAALPDGYLTELGERGASMSSGQRQLIALARAQLADPTLLLLDEATSNLDLATESRVNAAMRRVARDRTTIVIAHRLQTAQVADRIAVFEHGRIVEIGTHDELLDGDGTYAAMWRAFETADAA
ncbi:ABC transporter ATP-binding protein [Jatrophihabitans endophyticus]|uniref:ABC transporter ATP-binding protein n=1 Tax=Jatrophihabitans endophyticus TaxID=1206085 RepID=UPI0026F256CC|nr:ABC transporter ATP-binding protein [Jatrophihabitans endophyticus]